MNILASVVEIGESAYFNISDELLSSLLTGVISILGFLITYFSMKRTFKNEISKLLSEDRKKLYSKAFKLLDKAFINNNIVFNEDYLKQIIDIKPEIYLVGSNNVKELFGSFGSFVWKIQKDYKKFCYANNYEEFEYDEDGNIIGLNYSQYDVEKYVTLIREYKEKETPSSEIIREKVNQILNAMRNDIGAN